LDGYFAFVISDTKTGTVIVGRDAIGIMPLYWGYRRSDDTIWFASELKALHKQCDEFYIFQPGHVCKFQTGASKQQITDSLQRYFCPPWWDERFIPSEPLDLKLLRSTLEDAVSKRLMVSHFNSFLGGDMHFCKLMKEIKTLNTKCNDISEPTLAFFPPLTGGCSIWSSVVWWPGLFFDCIFDCPSDAQTKGHAVT
jgi:hypothetical protein